MKNFLYSYAANFRRFCQFCIYDAKVRIFRESCKLFTDYFSEKNRGSFSLFHFLTFDISIFEICQAKIFHLYYYI